MRIAIAGLGTVGAGVVDLLQRNGDVIAGRSGRSFEIVAVSARDRSRDRGVDLSPYAWHDDPVAMAGEVDADVVVELIGGSDGIAKEVVDAALAHGRHVVTANKALLAHHGNELAEKADAAGARLAFEAAVAGGIPIVKAMREGLAANRTLRVYGILNGTCNFILTTMRDSGRSFADVLAEAQELGYAEADPSFDVDGIDAAHKLALLTSLGFGCRIDFEGVYIEGIRHIAIEDIVFADELGYRIKLLATARMTDHGIEQRVHPAMVSVESPIAHVDDVYNAVVVDGDFVGSTVYEGRGAGAGPTASAVVADLVDIARGNLGPTLSVPASHLTKPTRARMEDHVGSYYIRLVVIDRPGVIADIAGAFRDEQVSMEAVLQRGRNPDDIVRVVLTTHETRESAMVRALERIAALEAVVETPRMIRIEPVEGTRRT